MAVSYMRVSTQGQTTERQEESLKEWLAAHSAYELQDTKVDKQSGRNLNRLDWFINGGYPHGTVLVVEDIDRFSRLGVTDVVDLLFTSGARASPSPLLVIRLMARSSRTWTTRVRK